MGFILGIDPDLHDTGLALWSDGRRVARHYTSREGLKVQDAEVVLTRSRPFLACLRAVSVPRTLRGWRAVESMARALPPAISTLLEGYYDVEISLVVVEAQRVYPRSKVRPNDIVRLAAVAGAAAASIGDRRPQPTLRMPEPREWKGQVTKTAHQNRILRRAGLPWDEAIALAGNKTKAGHAVDALGLALWGAEQLEASRR